jgi:alpha-1,6-mannosyltransferase
MSIDIADHPLWTQFLARFILMVATLVSWCKFARAVDVRVGSKAYATIPYSPIGTYLLLITASQFHMPFYSSRMLPNVFALVLVLQSMAAWLQNDASTAASLLVFSTAVFRCDLLLLLFTVGLSWLITKRLSLVQAIRVGLLTGIFSLVLTVPLDSLMWQRWVWPEGEVFYYNTILGKSSDWGTSPWYWYASSALPKLLLAIFPLIPMAIFNIPEKAVALWESKPTISPFLDTTWLEYILPAIGFVAIYSCLGHKEVRFLFPVMPMFNLAGAVAIGRFHRLAFPPSNKDKTVSIVAKLGYTGCLLALCLSMMASIMFVAVSRLNYPGGEALLKLEKHLSKSLEQSLVPNQPDVKVYIDVAAAMSGVSLFGQRQAASQSNESVPLEWEFVKAGYEDEHALEEDIFEYSASFTHIIAESDHQETISNKKLSTNAFTLIDAIPGNPRMDLKGREIATQDALYLWERIGYWQGIRN